MLEPTLTTSADQYHLSSLAVHRAVECPAVRHHEKNKTSVMCVTFPSLMYDPCFTCRVPAMLLTVKRTALWLQLADSAERIKKPRKTRPVFLFFSLMNTLTWQKSQMLSNEGSRYFIRSMIIKMIQENKVT